MDDTVYHTNRIAQMSTQSGLLTTQSNAFEEQLNAVKTDGKLLGNTEPAGMLNDVGEAKQVLCDKANLKTKAGANITTLVA